MPSLTALCPPAAGPVCVSPSVLGYGSQGEMEKGKDRNPLPRQEWELGGTSEPCQGGPPSGGQSTAWAKALGQAAWGGRH